MKEKITAQDKAFGRAVEQSKPEFDAPDRKDMFDKTYAMAMEQTAREKRERAGVVRRRLNRSLVAVGIALLIIVVSTLIGVIAPPQSASADSWFSRVVMSLRNAFRIETSSEDMQDAPEDELREYSSIEAAHEDGYTGYAPTYIPEGFTMDYVSIRQTESNIYAQFVYVKNDNRISVIYQLVMNGQLDTIVDESQNVEPFEWNGFIGAITQYDGDIVALACVNKHTHELINAYGAISGDDVKAIINSMKQ